MKKRILRFLLTAILVWFAYDYFQMKISIDDIEYQAQAAQEAADHAKEIAEQAQHDADRANLTLHQ